MSVSRSRFKVPHVFVLLTAVILVSSALTWIIPSGSMKGPISSVSLPGRKLYLEIYLLIIVQRGA